MPSLLPHLFVASSSQSRTLADVLAAKLNESHEVHAESWSCPNEPQNDQHLLRKLIDASEKHDLAVVILTGDAVRKDVRDDREVLVPRANCIFELGLFIGAFGQPERCFLISALEPQVLFEEVSDIAGQLHSTLGPRDFSNKLECDAEADTHLPEILKWVKARSRHEGRPRLPALDIDGLLEREANDGVQNNDLVVVKENSPPERKLRYASIVMENMERPVNYLYLFGSDPKRSSRKKAYARIVELLRSMLASQVVPKEQFKLYDKTKKTEDKKSWLAGDAKPLSNAIQRMRKRMFIELHDSVEFDEFCIHRAGDADCRGYVKIMDRYVEVDSRKALARFHHYGVDDKGWQPERVFSKALDARHREGIECQIRDKLPEKLAEELIGACFG